MPRKEIISLSRSHLPPSSLFAGQFSQIQTSLPASSRFQAVFKAFYLGTHPAKEKTQTKLKHIYEQTRNQRRLEHHQRQAQTKVCQTHRRRSQVRPGPGG